jgi:hypothetical protein
MGKRSPDTPRVRNDLYSNILRDSAQFCFSFQVGIPTGEQLKMQHQSFLSDHKFL